MCLGLSEEKQLKPELEASRTAIVELPSWLPIPEGVLYGMVRDVLVPAVPGAPTRQPFVVMVSATTWGTVMVKTGSNAQDFRVWEIGHAF